jgi:hypothetical protein
MNDKIFHKNNFVFICLFLGGLLFVCNCDDDKSDNGLMVEVNDSVKKTDIIVDEPRWIDADVCLKLRSGPGTDYDTLEAIPYAEKVQLLEEEREAVTIGGVKGKWGKVSWNKKEGWVFGGFLSEEEVIALPELSERFVWKGQRINNPNYYSIFYPKEGWKGHITNIESYRRIDLTNGDTHIEIPTRGMGIGDVCKEEVAKIKIGKQINISVRKREISINGELFLITYDNYPEDFNICMTNMESSFSAYDLSVFEQMAFTVEVVSEKEYRHYWENFEGNGE